MKVSDQYKLRDELVEFGVDQENAERLVLEVKKKDFFGSGYTYQDLCDFIDFGEVLALVENEKEYTVNQ